MLSSGSILKSLSSSACCAFLFLTVLSSSVFARTIEGKIKVSPPFPSTATFLIPEKDQEACGKEKRSPRVLLTPKGYLANAVIKLKGDFPFSPDTAQKTEVLLNQQGCEFAPHVILADPQDTVSILNSDPFVHNVRAFDSKINMLFNDGMPPENNLLKKKFPTPGQYTVRCGIHKWMHAVLIVKEHPYYTLSGTDGSFKLENVPEGKLSLIVWHEMLGEITEEIPADKNTFEIVFPSKKI